MEGNLETAVDPKPAVRPPVLETKPVEVAVEVAAEPAPDERSSLATRALALLALGLVVTLFTFVGRTAYLAARDSFIVPAILSPDSELVLGNKLKVSELEVERGRAAAELEGVDADIAAAAEASQRLQQLRVAVTSARKLSSELTSEKAASSAADRLALSEQRRLLANMLDKQKAITRKAEADSDARVISRAEYTHELQVQNQLELALLDNARATMQAESQLHETTATARAMAGTGGTADMLARQEQGIRIDLELTRLASEARAKEAQRSALQQRIAKIDELSIQLRSRPIFRAVEQSLDVAFAPYTQMSGVQPGAPVYSCVWGLFSCRPVGTVTEVVPGEVVLPDPWGSQARGQYVVLQLVDHESAKAKTLRIRPQSVVVPAAALSTR